MRIEIRIAGFGGQGVVLAGYVLGKALALYEGLEAVMTQSYGPEARGGASSANLVVSNQPIAYPLVQQPDVLVALSQEAYTRFRPSAKPNALLLLEEDLVSPQAQEVYYAIPATRLAEEMGNRLVANIIMLGFFTAITTIVQPQNVLKALQTSVKARFLDLNQKAFSQGYAYGRENFPDCSPLELKVDKEEGR